MDITNQRRAVVSGPMEAAELARTAGAPVAVVLEYADPPVYATVGPAGEWRNDDDIAHAVGPAKAAGRAEGWTVWEDADGRVYIGGKFGPDGRRRLSDVEAVRLAIAAGVRCDADGRID